MSSLTIEEKHNLAIQLCEKHKITAYEIGEHTELNASGIHRILTREVKKPRNKTLNIILNYIENRIVGTDLDYQKPEQRNPEANDNKEEYGVKRFEDIVADRVSKKLESKIDEILKNQQQSRDLLQDEIIKRLIDLDDLLNELSKKKT